LEGNRRDYRRRGIVIRRIVEHLACTTAVSIYAESLAPVGDVAPECAERIIKWMALHGLMINAGAQAWTPTPVLRTGAAAELVPCEPDL
jgi:hypothetical protein